ncbi:PIG-L family deacetylase [Candidatus Berkelbacteria bacterium]|nr:PIG-L family deacetylase [Candidatus Berkelbacteria bacterium]
MGVIEQIERVVFVGKLNRWVNTLTIKPSTRRASLKSGVSAGKQETWQRPPKGRVLVVAPHPDDEVIGCGGAILLHRQQNAPVDVVFLHSLSPTRRVEAQVSAKALGVTPHFGQSALKKLILEDDILYLPGLVENNLDHLRSHRCICKLLQPGTRTSEVRVLLYEVWGPLFPNRLLTIDSVAKQKERIIRLYKSQLKDRDYDVATLALNRYRGASLNAGKYAEAFLELSVADYLQLLQLLL